MEIHARMEVLVQDMSMTTIVHVHLGTVVTGVK